MCRDKSPRVTALNLCLMSILISQQIAVGRFLRCVALRKFIFFTLDFIHVTILAMMTVNQTNQESSWHKGGKLHKKPLFLNTVLFICQSIALV